MHETSLDRTIRDYLTGEEMEETTYEEFRQALARILVEEKGYPRANLEAKVSIDFFVDGKDYCRIADLVAYDGGRPIFVLFFCAGQPGTFDREVVAAARLIDDGPAPLAMATDTKDAVLMETARGRVLDQGFGALPDWERLKALVEEHPAQEFGEEKLERERRILYTYTEFLVGACCGTVCPTSKEQNKE
jgi:hypothetical protein